MFAVDLFWPCIRWWHSFSVAVKAVNHSMSTQLFAGSCHTWF